MERRETGQEEWASVASPAMRPIRLAWLAGAGVAGLAAARTLVSRRRQGAAAVAHESRAAELKQRLAEARDLAGEREEFEAAETPIDQAEPAPDLAERRRAIHDRARAAAEEMRGQ